MKSLFEGKTLTAKSFSFLSPEHKRNFITENVKLKIKKEPDNPKKLWLNLNGMDILEWFKQKYQEVQQNFSMDKKPELSKSRGVKM
jgi:translation elongation factor EF-1alpha